MSQDDESHDEKLYFDPKGFAEFIEKFNKSQKDWRLLDEIAEEERENDKILHLYTDIKYVKRSASYDAKLSKILNMLNVECLAEHLIEPKINSIYPFLTLDEDTYLKEYLGQFIPLCDIGNGIKILQLPNDFPKTMEELSKIRKGLEKKPRIKLAGYCS